MRSVRIYLPLLLLACCVRPAAAGHATRQHTLSAHVVVQTSTSPRPVLQRELNALQDSIWAWRAAHPDDPFSENLYASHTTGQAVEVELLRADSSIRADFRTRVHDSPRIRLRGFDPDHDPWPAAPEGTAAPDTVAAMHTHFALYPSETETVVLTLRNTGCKELFFGEEYTLSRFRHGRWETLPTAGIFNALLHGLQPGGDYRFEARLYPRIYPAAYGRYRITERVEAAGRHYLIGAEFIVAPCIPFPGFNATTTDTPVR